MQFHCELEPFDQTCSRQIKATIWQKLDCLKQNWAKSINENSFIASCNFLITHVPGQIQAASKQTGIALPNVGKKNYGSHMESSNTCQRWRQFCTEQIRLEFLVSFFLGLKHCDVKKWAAGSEASRFLFFRHPKI